MAAQPDHIAVARSKHPSGHYAKVGEALLRAILAVAEADRTEARDRLARLGQRDVAVGDPAARGDEAARRHRQLLESSVAGGHSGPGHAAGTDHASLQLGDLGDCRLDGVLDRPDLGCEFVSGVFDLMLAHDCSLPRERNRADLIFRNWT